MSEIPQDHRETIRCPNALSSIIKATLVSLFIVLASSVSIKSDAATKNSSGTGPDDLSLKEPKKGPETESEMFSRLSEILGEYEKVKTDSQLRVFKGRHEFALKQFLELFKMRLKFFSIIFDKTKNSKAEQDIQDYKRFITKIEEILKADSAD